MGEGLLITQAFLLSIMYVETTISVQSLDLIPCVV